MVSLRKHKFLVIISASRSTDIPALNADWSFNRLEKDIVLGRILLMECRVM